MAPDFDLVIVGGGPAGLTAGLYAARARMKTVLLEKGAVGGQVLLTDWIENYPGFPEGLTGFDLMEKMAVHARRFGLETRTATVASMDLDKDVKTLYLEGEGPITTRTVILVTGAGPNKLGVPGEAAFTGKGVSYCATCDGPFYRDQEIAVIGGGNTAVQEANYLTRFASKVTLIHRRDQLRATKIVQEKAFANPKIAFRWNSVVTAIEGDSGVRRVRLQDTETGVREALDLQGVFVLIGVRANNQCIPLDVVGADKDGFILTDSEMRTRIPGVYAAGDIRSKEVRQVINAAGEAAVASWMAEQYVSGYE